MFALWLQYVPIHASIYPAIHVSIYPSIHAYSHPSIHPSIHPFIYLFCLSIHLSICASIHPSAHPSIRPSAHPLAQLLRWSPPGFGYKIFYFCMSCIRLIMERDLGEASHCQGHWKFGNTKLSFVWSLPAVVSLSILTLGLFNSLQVHSDLSDRMP